MFQPPFQSLIRAASSGRTSEKRITASQAKQNVKFKSFQKAANSLAHIIDEGVEFDRQEMKHGRAWERVARDITLAYMSDYINVKCEQIGLLIDDTIP